MALALSDALESKLRVLEKSQAHASAVTGSHRIFGETDSLPPSLAGSLSLLEIR